MNIEKTYKLHIKENIFELTEEEISALYETCRKALNISYVGPIPSKPNDNPTPTYPNWPTYPSWPTYPGIDPYKDWLVKGNGTGTNPCSIPTITSTKNFFTDNPQNDEEVTKTFINNQTISDNKDKREMRNDMKEGDKFIHTDILGKKWELTYTGPRREVKGCEFEFFIDDKGRGCFFTDSEVDNMEKISG